MQRQTDEGIIISCDFTGQDWDEKTPMIEGHQGSVLSLPALSRAIAEARPLTATEADQSVQCSMCLRRLESGERAWSNPDQPESPGANPNATICWDCVQQADRSFSRDPDTDWDRKVTPTRRWR